MYLASITHRDRLFDLATRWFGDRPEPGDGRFLTETFIYDEVVTGPTVRTFLTDVQRSVAPGPTRLVRLRSKDELRDTIVASCASPTPREAELFDLYRRRREEFFPGTPADVVIGLRDDGSLLGMVRIKRLRRIAEKASRRVADHLAGAIHSRARALAAQRAMIAGVPLEQLVSPPETMLEDFATAERVVSLAFRDRRVTFEPQDLRVDDGIGIKFVGTPEELETIERAIREHPAVVSLAREEHRGRYNDVNLCVDLQLPPSREIVARERGRDWSYARGRGLAPDVLAADFPAYVESGARTFRAEVILTTRGELVESEFGRAIHEQRILEQRQGTPYSGRIAGNAGFLIEYMLMLALSPTVEIDALPAKMWGRYLPDVYAIAVWKLFGITIGRDLIDAFIPAPDLVVAGS